MDLQVQLKEIIQAICNKSCLNPPFIYENNIISDFNKRTEEYYQLIIELSKNDELTILKEVRTSLKSIKTLAKHISESMRHYLNGDINQSYKKLDYAINKTKTKDHLDKTAIPLSKLCDITTPLYRVRKSEEPLRERSDLFHIPFTKRHLVGAQRYSVSGLPCLYLGTSILVCWQEMGKPDFDKLYISAFVATELAEEMKILDLAFNLVSTLTYKPYEIFFDGSDDESITSRIISNLIIWPLVLACNYTKQKNGSFNVEYIIPNLLMQWVSNNKGNNIAGISYKTTKLLNQKDSNIGINVILPPKHDNSIDHNTLFCNDLKSTFKLTKPVSWQVLRTLDTAIGTEKNLISSLSLNPMDGTVDNLDEFLIEKYDLTEFKRIENLITKLMQFDYISQ